MDHQKQKRPTIAGSGISKSIHLQQANSSYFNMIVSNPSRTLFLHNFHSKCWGQV